MPCATDVFAARSMVMRLAKLMQCTYRMQMQNFLPDEDAGASFIFDSWAASYSFNPNFDQKKKSLEMKETKQNKKRGSLTLWWDSSYYYFLNLLYQI